MIEQQIASKTQTLEARGLPYKRAAMKAEATVIGKLVVAMSLLLMLAVLVLAGMIVLTGQELTTAHVVLVIIFGALGFTMFGIGMPMISRDAEPGIAKMGDWVIRLARVARGKGNGSAKGE